MSDPRQHTPKNTPSPSEETHPNLPAAPGPSGQQASGDTLPQVDWQIGAESSQVNFPRPDGVVAGLIQFPAEDDKHDNINRALQLAWEAADAGADIIAFHEMFMLPWVFFDEEPGYEDLADTIDSPVWEPFRMLAAEKEVVLVCSFYEAGIEGRCYNSALVIDTDGVIAGRYRKRHLPPDTERVHFARGGGPFATFPTRKGRIGVYICWDNFFPEGARALALDGADIVFAPSAATELESAHRWRLAIQANAMFNGIPWVRINRSEVPFYANKFVAGADGKMTFYSDEPGEWVSLVEIDYTATDRSRAGWTFLQDRRPRLYKRLTE